MRSAFLFLLLNAILCSSAFGITIQGITFSKGEHEPIPYVHVYINGQAGTSSDEKGMFVFQHLNPGIYSLTFSAIGYETKNLEVTLQQGKPLEDLGNVELLYKSNAIDEVLIEHSTAAYKSRYIGSNVLISGKDLDRLMPVGTEEALKTVPGVNVAGDMGISNRLNVGIRGSYPRRSDKILVLEDGSPVAPAPYLAPSAYYNPPAERLDAIEVIKGSDILSLGGNTMYGAINYITKRPPATPRFTGDFKGGTDGYNSQFLTYGGTWKNTGAELQLLRKSFDGFVDHSATEIYNATAKVFSELDERQTIYLKLNYHHENSQATYSGITPLTFQLEPRQNPFDADDLVTSRIALDMVYSVDLTSNITLNSKVYAHQFKRDWWRQNTTLIKAAEAENYLGATIFNDRYTYLQGIEFGEDDYVRVGRIGNGRESTKARNRQFRVAGIRETLHHRLVRPNLSNDLEVGIRYQREQFLNEEITNDSSRFSRSGTLVKDEQFGLDAVSAHVKNTFVWKRFTITPTIRYELIHMVRTDLFKASNDPTNDGSRDFARSTNTFYSIIPGVGMQYEFIAQENHQMAVIAGLYKGYTPPTTSFGFLSVEEDVVTQPVEEEEISMKAETSLNFEVGMRGTAWSDLVNGQITYFRNRIDNFYAAGRREAFQTLGGVRVHGLEIGLSFHPLRLIPNQKHDFAFTASTTLLSSRIISGRLSDSDLLQLKHTAATKEELIDKINGERTGYDVYFGSDSLIDRSLNADDFDHITRIATTFGEGDVANNHTPYTPGYIMNFGLSYGYSGFQISANINLIGDQYTSYLNFENESAEGALGAIAAFQTYDLMLSYEVTSQKSKLLDGMSFYVSGKNLNNDIYRASRLHRLSSGIMPGGFRQVFGGLSFSF